VNLENVAKLAIPEETPRRGRPEFPVVQTPQAGRLLASWQTPVVNDALGSDYAYGPKRPDGTRNVFLKLPGEAKLASWATPRGEISGDTADSHEARQTRVVAKHGRRMGTPLEVQASLASWASPMALDYRTVTGREFQQRDNATQNVNVQATLASGPMPTGSPAETASSGQLNPRLSGWLMGFPMTWDLCAFKVIPIVRTRNVLRTPRSSKKARPA
jgi:hypothetical protein